MAKALEQFWKLLSIGEVPRISLRHRNIDFVELRQLTGRFGIEDQVAALYMCQRHFTGQPMVLFQGAFVAGELDQMSIFLVAMRADILTVWIPATCAVRAFKAWSKLSVTELKGLYLKAQVENLGEGRINLGRMDGRSARKIVERYLNGDSQRAIYDLTEDNDIFVTIPSVIALAS